MKNNNKVVTLPPAVQFGMDGWLTLVRQDRNNVFFQLEGTDTHWIFKRTPNFARKVLRIRPQAGGYMLIFSYRIAGKLRDRFRLLQSVRKKLMKAVTAEQQQFEDKTREAKSLKQQAA